MGQSLTLYELSAEYHAVARELVDVDDPEAVRDTLESIREPLERKAISVAAVIRNFESLAGSMKEEEARMAARRKALESRVTWLKGYLQGHLELAGLPEVQAPTFKVAVRPNPPSVLILEPAKVPAAYMVIPDAPPAYPDKRKICEALKAGTDVPGCRLDIKSRLDIR